VKLADGFEFTEGPATDAQGNVFFTDIRTSRIYKWSVDGQLSTFRTNSGGANGLFFDRDGNLLACEGDNGRLVSIDPQGNVTVLADKYNNKRFNKPNDLWIDPEGGVYFSDPAYQAKVVQDGEHVYYLTPDRSDVIRVIDDMVRPNGIIGTPDGKVLYVTDHGAKKTYMYDINSDGTLSNKTLFTSRGSDGMTIDNEGNIYLTENSVLVYDSAGNRIEEISIPERPTNVCFGGTDRHTLFITARSSFHSIRMRVRGISHFTSACDLDDDGNVDFADHIILADSWMSACSKFVWCNDAGYNSGGQVDVFDPVTLTEHWLNAERGGTL
jgi:gluconolactonase